MKSEVIIEEGIVVKADNGFADVAVAETGNCEECSAKIICKPRTGNENIVHVIDPFSVKPGDKVRFEVKGSALLSASFSLYGIPLILIIIGTVFGLSIFSGYNGKEFFAFLFGAGLAVIYYFIFFKKAGKNEKEIMPVIISVSLNEPS